MKLVIASDIHGDAKCCKQLLDYYDQSGAEKLILLGDLLYHGPRNDIPDGYAPKEVIRMLNDHKDEILAVRGNCDAEVDQMVLEFPIMSDYAALFERGKMLFLTHGHLYHEEQMPPVQQGTVLIHGHTHVLGETAYPGGVCLNPGSTSLPKNGNPKSFMVYEDGLFRILSMEDGTVLYSYEMDS